MEGLLPLFYRAIKKNRTRRQYECLSSGTAPNYEMAEFFPQSYVHQTTSTQIATDLYAEKNGHRRNKSMGDFAYGFSSPQQIGRNATSSTPKRLVRFRSQKILSCINGV